MKENEKIILFKESKRYFVSYTFGGQGEGFNGSGTMKTKKDMDLEEFTLNLKAYLSESGDRKIDNLVIIFFKEIE